MCWICWMNGWFQNSRHGHSDSAGTARIRPEEDHSHSLFSARHASRYLSAISDLWTKGGKTKNSAIHPIHQQISQNSAHRKIVCHVRREKAYFLNLPRKGALFLWDAIYGSHFERPVHQAINQSHNAVCFLLQTNENQKPDPNMRVFSLETGECLSTLIAQKKDTWEPQWTADESIVARMTGGEIYFYYGANFTGLSTQFVWRIERNSSIINC